MTHISNGTFSITIIILFYYYLFYYFILILVEFYSITEKKSKFYRKIVAIAKYKKWDNPHSERESKTNNRCSLSRMWTIASKNSDKSE